MWASIHLTLALFPSTVHPSGSPSGMAVIIRISTGKQSAELRGPLMKYCLFTEVPAGLRDTEKLGLKRNE